VNKLADRSIPGVFFGYETGTKGYRIYDPIKDKLMISRDVIFDEKRAWNWGENESSQGNEAVAPYTFNVQFPDTVPGPTIGLDSELGADPSLGDAPVSPVDSIPSQGDSNSPPHTPVSSGTAAVPFQFATPPTDASKDSDGAPRRYRTIPNLLDTTEEIHGLEYSGLCLVATKEPGSVEEAMKEDCWRHAMQVEMQAIQENKTWVASDLPSNQKAIGLKWVFKVKKDPEPKIVKYKAWLVAKGYAQQ
jgi:hypothetical protein